MAQRAAPSEGRARMPPVAKTPPQLSPRRLKGSHSIQLNFSVRNLARMQQGHVHMGHVRQSLLLKFIVLYIQEQDCNQVV